MEDRYESIHETVLMENCKYTAAPSVKSEQKLAFGGLGTWLNMTEAGWVVKTHKCLVSVLLSLSPFSVLEYKFPLTTTPPQKYLPLSF